MRTLLALGVLFIISTAVAAQSLPPQPKRCAIPAIDREIHRIAQAWMDGYNEGDADKVAALYADDATYLTQHFVSGIVHGRPAIRAYVKKGTDAKYKIDSIQVLASDCSGDFAYSITRYDSTNGNQKAFGVNIVVVKKLNGEWLIVAHESAVPDSATAIQSLEIVKQ